MRINTVFGSIGETKTIKKQNMTAVEWLLNEINKLTGLTINPDEPIVEQAKQMEKEQSKQEYEYIGECKGNDGNGCFMDSPGHNCGCFVRIPKQEPTIEQIDQNNPVTRGSTALLYRDGTPMRKYNSPKLQAIEMENKLQEAAETNSEKHHYAFGQQSEFYQIGFIEGAKWQVETFPPQTEISDDEIENEVDRYEKVDGINSFKEAIKWYREQLNNKND